MVAKLLKAGDIDSQETLRASLRRHGFEVTQATLSRDLAALGAWRVTMPGGGSRYEIEAPNAPPAQPSSVNAMVRDVVSNGAIVVVLSTLGAASVVGAAIDAAAMDDVLGTLAGDDTLFVAPRQAKHANRLAGQLRELFGMEA